MVKHAVARKVDFEPIDRLEEKVKQLVALVTRLRSEQAQALEDNRRMSQEVVSLRARLADVDGTSEELTAMREERDAIRERVAEMLQKLEAI